jgi:hypothetical protein
MCKYLILAALKSCIATTHTLKTKLNSVAFSPHVNYTVLLPTKTKEQVCRYILYILKKVLYWHWGQQLCLYFKSISITTFFSSWYLSIYKNWVNRLHSYSSSSFNWCPHQCHSVSFNYTHFHFAAQVLDEWDKHIWTVPFLSLTGSSIYNSNWTWHCILFKALLNGESFEDEVCYKLKLHLRNSFSIIWTTIFIILIPY